MSGKDELRCTYQEFGPLLMILTGQFQSHKLCVDN